MADTEPTNQSILFKESNSPPWREHLGLIVSGAAFFIVTLRVLGVSRWDVTTARAVVQAGGASNVAVGSAIASLPTVAGLLVIFFGVNAARWIAARAWPASMWSFPVMVALLLLLAPVVAVFNLVVAAVALLIGFVLRRRRGQAVPKGVPGWQPEAKAILTVMVVSQLVLMSSQSWLPTERLRVDGHRAFMGYVVGRDGDDVVVLRARGNPQLNEFERPLFIATIAPTICHRGSSPASTP